jgi:vitamin B12 transporter
MKKTYFLFFIFLYFSFIFSQTYTTDTVYVYAKRIKEKITTLSLPITIIDKNFLRAFPTIEIKNSLNYISGIFLNSYSFYRGLTSVSLQGNPNTSHTLILFNNMPINQPSTGTADLGLLPFNSVSKIEIYKGAVSNIYGANALNGVINFLPLIEKEKLFFDFAYGENKTRQFLFKSNYQISSYLFSLNGEAFKTNGMRTNDDQKFINLTLFLEKKDFLKLMSGFSLREMGVPGPKPNPNFIPSFGDSLSYSTIDRQKDTFAFFNLNLSPYLEDIIQFHYQFFYTHQKTNFASFETTSTKNNSLGNNLIFSHYFGKDNNFNFGLELKQEKTEYKNSSPFNVSRTILGLFYNFKYQIKENFFDELGIRIDDYGNGRFISYSFGLAYRIENQIIKGYFGRSFRAPSLNDLYWPKTEIFPGFYLLGNQDLKSEIGNIFQISYQLEKEKYQFTINPFLKRIKDLIRWTLDPTMTKWLPVNLDKSFVYGSELSFRIKPNTNGEFLFNATLLNGNEWLKVNKDFQKRELTYLPKLLLSSQIIFLKNPQLAINFSYRTKKVNYYGEKIKTISPRLVIDGKITYHLFNKCQLNLILFNLLNKEYSEMFGYTIDDYNYPIGKRKFFFSISFTPF